MHWRFPLVVVIFIILSQVIHSLGAFVGMKYYLMSQYFPVWSKLMADQSGPPPTSFYLYSLLFSAISGALLALVYLLVEKSLRGKTCLLKGLFFGLLIILVAGIPGTFAMILLTNLPIFLIISWFVEGCLISLLSGILFAVLLKQKSFFEKIFNR
jgi:hypothetical protein